VESPALAERAGGERRAHGLVALALGVLGLVAFANGLDVPFLFDDVPAIVTNPRVEHLWPFGVPAPPQSPDGGRPVVALTFSLNHALGELEVPEGGLGRALRALGIGAGGRNPRGYHVVNVLLQVLSAFVLYLLVRRTLALADARPPEARDAARGLAFTVAALWLVHPLQVDAVTYVIQRTELLMGLFAFTTLYAAHAAARGRRPRLAALASVLACALGMMSKEAMAAVPILVALYDRAFLYPSWRAALRARRTLYAGLASTWLILAVIVASGPRNETVGFGLGVAWWRYAATQLAMIAHYLRLVVWPSELCFDYGRRLADAREVLLGALVVVPLALGTLWALARRPRLGFLGAWLFGILGPSSSIVPIVSEVGAERRMHLPLATVVVALVIGVHALVARRAPSAQGTSPSSRGQRLALALGVLALLALATGVTIRRNAVHQSDLSIWLDTLAKRPENARAHNNLGQAYAKRGRHAEALHHYQLATSLPGVDPYFYLNLGQALADLGRGDDAIAFFAALARDNPGFAVAHECLARAYMSRERWTEAAAEFRSALALLETADVHNDLARCLYRAGQLAEAEQHLVRALELAPGHALATQNLAKVRERLAVDG
jgi:tetratricopeptide (TPR) repeat protein